MSHYFIQTETIFKLIKAEPFQSSTSDFHSWLNFPVGSYDTIQELIEYLKEYSELKDDEINDILRGINAN